MSKRLDLDMALAQLRIDALEEELRYVRPVVEAARTYVANMPVDWAEIPLTKALRKLDSQSWASERKTSQRKD